MFDSTVKFFVTLVVFYVIWAIFDCLKNEKEKRYFWLLILLATGIIGAIPYSLRARKRRGSFSSFKSDFGFKEWN